jgi:hypothetical protein
MRHVQRANQKFTFRAAIAGATRQRISCRVSMHRVGIVVVARGAVLRSMHKLFVWINQLIEEFNFYCPDER